MENSQEYPMLNERKNKKGAFVCPYCQEEIDKRLLHIKEKCKNPVGYFYRIFAILIVSLLLEGIVFLFNGMLEKGTMSVQIFLNSSAVLALVYLFAISDITSK